MNVFDRESLQYIKGEYSVTTFYISAKGGCYISFIDYESRNQKTFLLVLALAQKGIWCKRSENFKTYIFTVTGYFERNGIHRMGFLLCARH